MNKVREFLERFGDSIEKTAVSEPLQCVPPRELHLELTYRCNTSCIMCNLRYLKTKDRELDCGEIARIVGESQLLKDLRFIVLSGGEAWLKEDFIDIVKFFRTRYPSTSLLVLSNLSDTSLTIDRIDRIRAEVGLEHISIGSSLDGVGAVHDRIRGRAGSFDELQKTLSVLRERYPGLYFSLNYTLTPENCDQMVPAFEWCSERDYHISYQVMVQKKETGQFTWEESHFNAVDAQIDGMLERMCRRHGIEGDAGCELLKNEGLLSLMLGLHYIGKYIRKQKRYFPACPCGEKYAMLDPVGNLYFCPVRKQMIAGSLRNRPFDELWTSAESARIRQAFNGKDCHCWLTCTNGYMLGNAIANGKNKYLRDLFGRGTDTV